MYIYATDCDEVGLMTITQFYIWMTLKSEDMLDTPTKERYKKEFKV